MSQVSYPSDPLFAHDVSKCKDGYSKNAHLQASQCDFALNVIQERQGDKQTCCLTPYSVSSFLAKA